MIRRLCAAAACALLAFPGALPVADARPGTSCWPDQARVWRIRRHGTAPRPLTADLRITAHGQHFTAIVLAAEVRNGRWSKFGAIQETEGGNGPYPYVYGGDAAPVASPDRPNTVPQACDGPGVVGGAGGTFDWPIFVMRGKATTFDWFVATIQAEVTVTLNSGWTVTELKPDSGANFRIYRNYDGDGAGLEVWHDSVEHFTGVAADGGRYGSLAMATLPCMPDDIAAQVGVWTARGWGAGILLGGDSTPFSIHDRNMKCDGFDLQGFGAATGPTKWNFYGEAVGQTVALNRLTIFDFPKPDRAR